MDKMGATAGIRPDGIVYTGSRDDLQRKLRDRDDRITVLEAALREIAGGEISGHGEIVVRSDSMRLAHEALEQPST